MPTREQILQALATVEDPQIGRPLPELDLVSGVVVDGGVVSVEVRVAVPGGATEERLRADVGAAVRSVPGVREARVSLAPLAADERAALAARLRPRQAAPGGQPVIPFAQMDSRTKVIAIASGKGGVGKSSVTTNLAVALADEGLRVGVLDADIWGYSIPRMMGAAGQPVAFENVVLPLQAHGCKLISIGFFVDTERPVIWRGPMLHRALQQFLADVYWGDLDFLLCDLPPGTGDIAISLAQMLPNADLILVTTPQQAAQRVALRAGQMTAQTGMKVAGVIENMATFVAPDTGREYHIFGEGGGRQLAAELGTELLGSIPIDPQLREGADAGVPLVRSAPQSPTAERIRAIARRLESNRRTIVGKPLPLRS